MAMGAILPLRYAASAGAAAAARSGAVTSAASGTDTVMGLASLQARAQQLGPRGILSAACISMGANAGTHPHTLSCTLRDYASSFVHWQSMIILSDFTVVKAVQQVYLMQRLYSARFMCTST